MTENEAARYLQALTFNIVRRKMPKNRKIINVALEAVVMGMEALEEIQQYRALGTVEELREAMEKQRAKKPVEDRCAEHIHYKCKCGYIFHTEYADGLRAGCIYHYCPDCGQAIDWSEKE